AVAYHAASVCATAARWAACSDHSTEYSPVTVLRAPQRVDRRHLVHSELEVEDVGVAHYPLAPGGLGDHHDTVLDVPANDDLLGELAMPVGDLHQRRVVERSRTEWAVALDHDVAFPVRRQQFGAEQQRAPLDLVHGRRSSGGLGDLVDLLERVVA